MASWKAYTDGGCMNNQGAQGGPGGIGVHVIYGEEIMEFSVGYKNTTNNRMELRAIIYCLELFQDPVTIEIFTDSQYTIDGATKWIHGWKKRNWITGNGTPVKNKDLFLKLDELLRFHNVVLTKVKGHSGIPGNEAADRLATEGRDNPTEVDEGYNPQAETVPVVPNTNWQPYKRWNNYHKNKKNKAA